MRVSFRPLDPTVRASPGKPGGRVTGGPRSRTRGASGTGRLRWTQLPVAKDLVSHVPMRVEAGALGRGSPGRQRGGGAGVLARLSRSAARG